MWEEILRQKVTKSSINIYQFKRKVLNLCRFVVNCSFFFFFKHSKMNENVFFLWLITVRKKEVGIFNSLAFYVCPIIACIEKDIITMQMV